MSEDPLNEEESKQENAAPIEPKQVDLEILRNVYGDPRRFIQIMQNFLSNALKFTNKNGDITIVTSLLEVQEIQSEE